MGFLVSILTAATSLLCYRPAQSIMDQQLFWSFSLIYLASATLYLLKLARSAGVVFCSTARQELSWCVNSITPSTCTWPTKPITQNVRHAARHFVPLAALFWPGAAIIVCKGRQSAIRRKAAVLKQWLSPTKTSANGHKRNIDTLIDKSSVSATTQQLLTSSLSNNWDYAFSLINVRRRESIGCQAFKLFKQVSRFKSVRFSTNN